MKTDLFPETIKIGAHTVAICEHDSEFSHSCAFVYETPKITYLSRKGSLSDFTDLVILRHVIERLLYAIFQYSCFRYGEKDWPGEAKELNVISGGILQAIKCNLIKYGDSLSVINVDGEFLPPPTVEIGALTFSIKFTDEFSESRKLDRAAYADESCQTIAVFKHNSNSLIADNAYHWISLWHEIFHMIFSNYNFEKFSNDEQLVCTLSEWWVMVLRDNPEFVQCIKNILSGNGKE